MKVLARVNPAYASALAKEQSTRAAIAKVTAQEQKAWTRENTLKVEATQAYKESENKGQYLKQELQNIRVEEAEYRAEKAEIAAQNREEKFDNLIVAEAEMDKVKPVTPYVVSSYLDKEEETWLKGNESQRAWAAVNAQEEAKKAEQERQNAVSAARWAGLASVAQEKQDGGSGKALAMPAQQTQSSWLSNIPVIGKSLDNAYSELRNIVQDKSSSKTESLITWSIWNNPVFQAGIKNEAIRNFYQGYTAVVGDSLRSIADPERNPRTAATRQMFIDGYNAWFGEGGIKDKYFSAFGATWRAIKDRRWKDADLGAKIISAESKALADGVSEAVKMSVMGILTTPIRIFTHDIPEFYNAGKERMEGKDRFWDVLFTSTNLMGDVTGTYSTVKPIGLLDSPNSWLSKSLLGRELPVIPPKFAPYYLKDLFKGGVNRNLINNLVENTYSAPSQTMQLALKYQSGYFQYQQYLPRMINISEKIQSLMPEGKPIQITDDLIQLYLDAADATPELQKMIIEFSEKTGGTPEFPLGLKELDRAMEKISSDYLEPINGSGDFIENSAKITDITRGRIVYDTLKELYEGLDNISQDANFVFFKDRFLKPKESGYSDILMNVKLSNEHIGEIRLEVRPINKTAKIEHLVYEEKRSIEAVAIQENRPLSSNEFAVIENLKEQSQLLYREAWKLVIEDFSK